VKIQARLVRRVLLALSVGVVALGSAVYVSQAQASTPKPTAAPVTTTTSTSAPTTTTTTTPPPPETEPAPEPEPAPKPPPAPKPAPKPAPAASGSSAAQLISLVNSYRSAHGLGPLSQASDATAKAVKHSQDMAAQGRMYHSSSMSSGISGGWTALGENVGVGGSVSQVESMFEASGPHSANLLNDAFTQIGVGVVQGDDGQLYITQFFVGR
jgi:uncharacterized protein YkwD